MLHIRDRIKVISPKAMIVTVYFCITCMSLLYHIQTNVELKQLQDIYGHWNVAMFDVAANSIEYLNMSKDVSQARISSFGEAYDIGIVGSMDESVESLLYMDLLEGKKPNNTDEVLMVQSYDAYNRGIYELGDKIYLNISNQIHSIDFWEYLDEVYKEQGTSAVDLRGKRLKTSKHEEYDDLKFFIDREYYYIYNDTQEVGDSTVIEQGKLIEMTVRYCKEFVVSGLLEPYENRVDKGETRLPVAFIHDDNTRLFERIWENNNIVELPNNAMMEHRFYYSNSMNNQEILSELNYIGNISENTNIRENSYNQRFYHMDDMIILIIGLVLFSISYVIHYILQNYYKEYYMVSLKEYGIKCAMIGLGVCIIVTMLVSNIFETTSNLHYNYYIYWSIATILGLYVPIYKRSFKWNMTIVCEIVIIIGLFLIYQSNEHYKSQKDLFHNVDYIVESVNTSNVRLLQQVKELKLIDGIENVRTYKHGENVIISNPEILEDTIIQSLLELKQDKIEGVDSKENWFHLSDNILYNQKESYFDKKTHVVTDFFAVDSENSIFTDILSSITVGDINLSEFDKGNEVVLMIPLINSSKTHTSYEKLYNGIYQREEVIKVGDSIRLSTYYTRENELMIQPKYHQMKVAAILYFYPENPIFVGVEDIYYGIIGSSKAYHRLYPSDGIITASSEDLTNQYAYNVKEMLGKTVIYIDGNDSTLKHMENEEVKDFILAHNDEFFRYYQELSISKYEKNTRNICIVLTLIGTILIISCFIPYEKTILIYLRIKNKSYQRLTIVDMKSSIVHFIVSHVIGLSIILITYIIFLVISSSEQGIVHIIEQIRYQSNKISSSKEVRIYMSIFGACLIILYRFILITNKVNITTMESMEEYIEHDNMNEETNSEVTFSKVTNSEEGMRYRIKYEDEVLNLLVASKESVGWEQSGELERLLKERYSRK